MKSRIDTFNDSTFKEIVSSSSTWKELAERFGYESTLSSNLKAKIIQRCKSLGIPCLEIAKKIPANQRTKGELFTTLKNWQTARTAIRKNAQAVFDKSNIPRCCAVCGYDKHIEIAHIKAVADFDDTTLVSEINDIDNLIALCPNHHWEYDNGLLEL